jgi:hypothetical protein
MKNKYEIPECNNFTKQMYYIRQSYKVKNK